MRGAGIRPGAAVVALAFVLTGCGGGPTSAGGKLSGDKIVLAVLNDELTAFEMRLRHFAWDRI